MHSSELVDLFAKTAKKIAESHITSISVWQNFMSEACSNKTMAALLNEDFPGSLRLERSLILSRLGRDPCIESIIEDYQNEHEVIITGYCDSTESLSVAAAFASKHALYDIASSSEYTHIESCKISIESLEHNQTDTRLSDFQAYFVYHDQDKQTTNDILMRCRIDKRPTVTQVIELLDASQTVKLFPAARTQIEQIGNRAEMNSVLYHLVAIASWSLKLPATDLYELQLRASEESQTTLKSSRLMAHRQFSDGEGNSVEFSFHTKPAGGLRIYLKLESAERVSIGYVGPHLPT